MFAKSVSCPVGVDTPLDALRPLVRDCRESGRHLSLALIKRLPPIPATAPYGMMADGVWVQEFDMGREDLVRRTDELERFCAEEDVSADVTGYHLERGQIPSIVGRHARYADATVVLAPSVAGEGRKRFVEGGLFEGGGPVILLPDGDVGFPSTGRIMIAWNGWVEAARAVHASLGLLESADAVHAVLVDPIASSYEHGEEPGADLAAYLARHDVKVEVERLPSEGRAIWNVLAAHAVDIGADLLVMGGYGHSRMRQNVFGGTTSDAIRDLTRPVLMAH